MMQCVAGDGRPSRIRRDRTPDAVDAEDVLPDGTPRSRGVDGDDVVPDERYRYDGDEDIPESRLRVIMEARVLAEVQDGSNVPVSTAVGVLNTTFTRSNPWINEFYSVRTSPGQYQILMRSNLIDGNYSSEDEGGSNLDQLDERPRQRMQELMQQTGLSDEQVGRMIAVMDNPNETIVGAVQQLNNISVSPDDMVRFVEAMPNGQRGTVFNEIADFRTRRQADDTFGVDEFIQFRQRNPIIPTNWDRFNPTHNEEFIERLREFQGEGNLDLTRPPRLAGGEGQLFLSPNNPNVALKRWFATRIDDMPESLRLLDEAALAIDGNADIARHLDVVRIYDRGTDWIVRDFVNGTDSLRDVIGSNNPAAQAALDAVVPHLTGGGILDTIASKFRGEISENLHWSETLRRIIILDMM